LITSITFHLASSRLSHYPKRI